jgi:hypothetical protein
MKETKAYLVKVYDCPHCGSTLSYSSKSGSLEKTMLSIFSLMRIHQCDKRIGKKWTRLSVCVEINRDGSIISEYKTNKILF